MSGRSAVIFVGGDEPDPRVVPHLDRASMVVAADSGWSHAVALGFTPGVLVGDMDSIAASDLEAARSGGTELREFPVDKDATDVELALQLALERGSESITVVSGVGDRLDHLMAMLHSLAGIDARVSAFVGVARIRFLSPTHDCEFDARVGSLVSLIPIGGDAEGVHTSGLKWNLVDGTLHSLRSRGVSNVVTESHVGMSLTNGRVAVVQPDFLEE